SAGKLHAAVSARAPAGWDPASGAGYSEFIAWRLLALAVEVATNAPWPDVVDALVLDRLGVSRDVHVALDRERASDRLGVNIDLRTRPRPMLSEMSSSFTSPNAAYGTFATATGLCRVLHCLATDPAAPGQTLLGEQRRGHRWDEVMQATVDTQPGL